MINMIQFLCPERHAIIATAYDPAELPDDVALATMQQTIEDLIEKKILNPWCGICGSKELCYEQRKTRFRTKDEAEREMKRLELENQLSRVLIDAEKARRN